MSRLFCLVSLLLIAAPAQASVELRKALGELAGEVKKVLDGKGASDVAIGKFDGPPSHKTSAGPGFTMILGEELAKLGITVKEQAKFGLEGRYALTEVPASDPGDASIGKTVLAVKVKLEVIDAFDNRDKVDFERKVLTEGERTVPGPATLVRTFGPSLPFKPNDTESQNDKAAREAIIRGAACHVDATRIQSKAGQPYAIEVLVNDAAKTPTVKDGLAFVDIARGDVYAVKLINDSPHEAAVQLFIDGISIYAFSELRSDDPKRKGEPKYTSVIVPAATGGKPGTAIIRGWHRNNEKNGEDSFLVTEYAKSAAAKLKRTEGLGLITATFQASWQGDAAPSDEPGKRRGGLGDATGFGPPAGSGFQEVSRTLGVLRDCISVRYTISQK